MSPAADPYARAQAFVAEHRIALVRELLAYRESAILGEGRLRELRDLIEPVGGSPMRMIESMVEDAAMKDLLRIYDQAQTPRGVLTARLKTAGARRCGGHYEPKSEDDARDGALMLEAADALRGLDQLRCAASRQRPKGRLRTSDPMEQIVEAALIEAGIDYLTDHNGESPCDLDFYLAAHDLHVEVKRMHSDRIAVQMSRAENVIAAQGEGAVLFLADLIRSSKAAQPA